MVVPHLGITELDDDHRDILLYLVQLRNNEAPIEKTINALTHYLSVHIAKEEKLMEDIKYPYLPPHRISHKYMKTITDQLIHEIIRKTPKEVSTLIDTVNNIFYNHVQVFDKKLADWIIMEKDKSVE